MTNRENALLALSGKKPESVPCAFSSVQFVCPDVAMEAPPMGSGAGVDGYGVHQTPTDSAGGMYTPTPSAPPVLTDVCEWKKQVHFPDYSGVDFAAAYEKDKAFFHWDPESRVQDFYSANGLFERLHFLMGFEEASMALLLEPEAVYDLVGAIADKKIEMVRVAARYYHADYFTLLDDYSHVSGPFMSLNTFREIFRPHYQRVIDAAHECGLKFKTHCCGKMDMFLDDFLEMGSDAFDPVQKVNDIPAMKRKTLGRAGLMGGLDVQGVVDMAGATEEQIRAEVRRCIDEYAAEGGYLVYGASVNMYTPQAYMPGGTLHIVLDECEKYGHLYYQ